MTLGKSVDSPCTLGGRRRRQGPVRDNLLDDCTAGAGQRLWEKSRWEGT